MYDSHLLTCSTLMSYVDDVVRIPLSTNSHFAQHGFRFVEVTGWSSAFTGGDTSSLDATGRDGSSLSLTSYLVHTNTVDISTTRFDSFDPKQHNIINNIKHLTLYAQKSNYHSIPTDCPTVRFLSDSLFSSGYGNCFAILALRLLLQLQLSQRERRGWMGE